MKKITLLLLLLSYFSFSQSLVKTYYDPFTKTKLKEVYQVKPNTPVANGYYKSYDEYGNLLVHRNYINNKQNGKSTTYYGAVEASLMPDDVRDKCLGQVSGNFNYKNDQLDGVQKRFDYSEEGIRYLQYKQVFQEGTEIESFEYYPNKNLKQHNRLNGICTGFYENGEKFEQFTLENGLYQGQYTSWYKSGKLLEEGKMVNDEKDGEWIEYNEDGTIKAKELYELGKRVPTEEEKELARQKQIEKAKKEEEKRKLLEEKRLAEQKEAERKKRIEEEKFALTKKVNDKAKEFDREKENVEAIYKVEDQVQSMLFDETVYKYKKKHLYNAYVVVVDHINSELRNTDELQEKNSLLSLGIEVTAKMKILRNKKSRDLEKKLKKIDEPTKIIEILELKK